MPYLSRVLKVVMSSDNILQELYNVINLFRDFVPMSLIVISPADFAAQRFKRMFCLTAQLHGDLLVIPPVSQEHRCSWERDCLRSRQWWQRGDIPSRICRSSLEL